MAEPQITNEQIEHLRQQLDVLESQKRLPLPTPEVGRIVWFYRQGDLNTDPIAAIVTGQDGPGQLSLQLHPRNAQTVINCVGIHFKDHPFLETNPQVAKMKNGGVWCYRDGDKPTQPHGQVHLAQLDQQIKAMRDGLLKARDDEIRRQQRDKALAAATSAPEKTGKTEKAKEAPVSTAS